MGPLVPFRSDYAPEDETDRDLSEVLAAIALVASGAARRVTLCCLRRPEASVLAATAAAKSAQVRLVLDGASEHAAVVVMPSPTVVDVARSTT